jgi:hypothetical protein
VTKLYKGKSNISTTSFKLSPRKSRLRMKTRKTTTVMTKMKIMATRMMRTQTILFWVMRWLRLVCLIF